jgi:hypothetical protein
LAEPSDLIPFALEATRTMSERVKVGVIVLNQQLGATRSATHAGISVSNILSFPQGGITQAARRLEPGQILSHEGVSSGWFYEVVSGMLKLSKVTSDGRILIVVFLLPGDVASLSDIDVYGCTAQAALPAPAASEGCRLPHRDGRAPDWRGGRP